MMWVVIMLLPSLAFTTVKAQDTLVLDIEKALEIALSENPTVKVANKEIQKKKYAQKGSYAALFPQVSFAADYNRTLKKQVMYMDGFDMGSTEIPGMEDMPNMDEGIEVGRDNNWNLGFNASMPIVNAALWKSLSISAVDVELAIEQARSSKIAMVNQVKNSEPNMLQAENALVLAKWQLKALLGMDLDINIECEGQLTDFEKDLFGDFLSTDTTLANNTDLKQMDLQAKQLEKTLTMQKFDYLPTLSLTGLYQWTAMNNDFKFKDYMWNPYSMVGLSLSIPIFSGGSKFYKIKQTRNSIEQLSLQREDTQRNLQLAIKQYIDNMNTCVKRFDASQKGVEQAERGYMISQKRYDTGAGTLLEMNDSELALTQAKLNFNQAIYDYMVAKADLEKVLGQQEF